MATATDLIPHRYNRVHVLLLSWEGGDPRIFEQLCELQEVFDVLYNYEVEEWKIPVTNPHRSLTSKILEFLANDDIGSLLIVYYAGHGGIDKDRDSVWMRVDDPTSAKVEWSSVQTVLLSDTVSDILILIDCCKAASSVRRRRFRQYGLVEVIAACGYESDTPLTGEQTFTANLVAQLKEVDMENNKLRNIYNDLLNRLKRFVRDEGFAYTVPAMYYCLADGFDDRSIHLIKQPPRPTARKTLSRNKRVLEASPKVPSEPSGQNHLQELSNSRGTQPSPDRPPEESPARTPETFQIQTSPDIRPNSQPDLNPTYSLEANQAKFLRALSFSTMNDRFDGVMQAHERTFGWILEETGKAHFVQWLSHENDLYWISGKAGSGKSTLMNFIYLDPRTLQYLRRWAGNRPLTIAQFFFWNSGSALQRSLEGLIRSLLYQILARQPDLISLVIEKASLDLNRLESTSWRLGQLKYAFHTAVQELSKTECLCLFVDGLDEYGGDPTLDTWDMVEFVRKLALIPNVKACVSSRPEPEIANALTGLPSLRLQDLTFLDIEHFVESSLMRNDRLSRSLDGLEPKTLSELITKIVEKSDGVFLWVALVVKSIQRGLLEGDPISVLYRRVDALPGSLDDLYDQMLDRVEPIYHEDASKIFQILRASQAQLVDRMSDEVSEPVFTTIGLYYALHYSQEEAIRAPIEILAPEKELQLISRASNMIRSRTAGFLSVHVNDRVSFNGKSEGDTLVSYSHQTARKFLEQDGNWNRQLSLTSGKRFDPNISILKSVVLQLKTLDFGQMGHVLSEEIYHLGCWGLLDQATSCARLVDETYSDEMIALMNELDRTMTTQLEKWSRNTVQNHWSSLLPLGFPRECEWHDTFLSFAVSYGVFAYVFTNALDGDNTLIAKEGRPLLDYAILPQPQQPTKDLDFRMIKYLLDLGADPNGKFCGETIWSHFLTMYHKFFASIGNDSRQAEKLRRVFNLFLDFGANPKVAVKIAFRYAKYHQ